MIRRVLSYAMKLQSFDELKRVKFKPYDSMIKCLTPFERTICLLEVCGTRSCFVVHTFALGDFAQGNPQSVARWESASCNRQYSEIRMSVWLGARWLRAAYATRFDTR